MQANARHPYLVQGWNWDWFGGRGREKKRSHTIEWDGTNETWRQVEAEITDAYFTWEDGYGMKREKQGIEYVEACNSLFDDAAEAWSGFQLYFEKWEAVQSRSFQGAKKLTMDRIEEHVEKHRRRLIALCFYLVVLQEGWQRGKHNNKPVDEWFEVWQAREGPRDRKWNEEQVDKLIENYDRMRNGDWREWKDQY